MNNEYKKGLQCDPRAQFLTEYNVSDGGLGYTLYYYLLGPFIAILRLLLFSLIYLYSSIAPKLLVIKTVPWLLCKLFCIRIKRNKTFVLEKDDILVSNHACFKDFAAILEVTKLSIDKGISVPTKLYFPQTVKFVHFVNIANKKKNDNSKNKVELNDSSNILIFPEGTFNDGTYMYKFNKFVFSLGKPIVPYAIKIKFPYGHHMRMPSASWFKMIYNILVVPWVNYEIEILDKMCIKPKEKPEEFAERCRRKIAKKANLRCENYLFKEIRQII
jgi:hypothetical protein